MRQQLNKLDCCYPKASGQRAGNPALISGLSVSSGQVERQISGGQRQDVQKMLKDYDVSTSPEPGLQRRVLPESPLSRDCSTMLPQEPGVAERLFVAGTKQINLTGFDLVHNLLRNSLTPWTKPEQSEKTLPFVSVLFSLPIAHTLISDISSVNIPTEESETILKNCLQKFEKTGCHYRFTGRIDCYSVEKERGWIRFFCNNRTKYEYFAYFKYDDVENTLQHKQKNLRIRSHKIVPKLVAHFFLRYNVLEPLNRQLEAFQITLPYLPYNYPPPSPPPPGCKKHRSIRL